MSIWNSESTIKAWNFASKAHNGQVVPGSKLPYINHIGNVTMEIMAAIARSDSIQYPDLAVQCALLHDTIEDTETSYDQLAQLFSNEIANGVLSLTKNKEIPSKNEKMRDSLNRIKQQPFEVWMVKLADRITNLQPPPEHWNKAKIKNYQQEAQFIHESLKEANDYLASRLLIKIDHYNQYCL